MSYNFSDLLKAVGGNAALVFAAWIFMTYLQGRYTAAFTVYRDLISSYRGGKLGDLERKSAAGEIRLYRRRCQLMMRATNVGMVSAIFLITALLVGAADVMFPGVPALKYIGTACVACGLVAVIISAVLVVVENTAVSDALDAELQTVPGLDKNG
jgi:hypothetical protein